LTFSPMEYAENFQRAKEVAINYLSYRPRSSKEVKTHLLHKGYLPELVDQVISYLQELEYINDLDFARKWYMTRISKGDHGHLLIQRELIEKGVSLEINENLRRELYPEEKEREYAQRLAEKRGFEREGDIRQRNKLYQFLLRRGFSPSVINELSVTKIK
jgi:regulatory protein